MATQVTGSPLGQSAIALWSGAPRGSTIVFGMAAAVATLSAGAVIVSAVSPSATPAAPASHAALVSSPAPSTVVPSTGAEHGLALPLLAPPTSTSTSGSGSAGSSSAYSWVDAGTGSGGGTAAAAAVVPVAAAGACAVPPAVGQAAGQSGGLGLSNAQSVASAPAVALPTVGPTVQFSTAASLSSFGSAAPGSVDVTLTTNACASSQGAWFSAQVSGVGTAVPLQLNGTLVEVIGTAGDLGYIFRGDVSPVSGLSNSADPLLDGATQFVAQLEVTEPANLAQLTVVFLNPTVGTADATSAVPSTTTGSPTTASTATAPATGATGTGVSTGSAESPVSLAAAGTGFGQIASGVPMALPAFSPSSGPSISFPAFGPG